jgi:hypothetical protein
MRHFLRIATCAILVGALASGVAVASDRRSTPDACPTVKQARSAGAPYVLLPEATRGVMQRLPKVFTDIAPGLPFKVELLGGFRLLPSYSVASRNNPSDPVRYFRAASRICGAKIAAISWAFTVGFPYAPNVLAGGYVVFIVKAKATGWSLYGWLELN